jgi:hypothetical protein
VAKGIIFTFVLNHLSRYIAFFPSVV